MGGGGGFDRDTAIPLALSALAGGVLFTAFPTLRRPIESVLAPLTSPKHISGTGHGVLNITAPRTSWGNLGLWKVDPMDLVEAWESGGSIDYAGLLSPRVSAAGGESSGSDEGSATHEPPCGALLFGAPGDGANSEEEQAEGTTRREEAQDFREDAQKLSLRFEEEEGGTISGTPMRGPSASSPRRVRRYAGSVVVTEVPLDTCQPPADAGDREPAAEERAPRTPVRNNNDDGDCEAAAKITDSRKLRRHLVGKMARKATSRKKTYPEACRDLAVLLSEAARVCPGDAVADCGFGCGDQAVLWAKRHALRRYVGFNPCPEQCEVAERICSAALANGTVSQCDFELVKGSASLLSGVRPGSLDRVLSLDAAYHFDTRAAFLADAFAALRPGGTIAVADIVSDSHREPQNPFARWFLRLALAMSSVPMANFHDCVTYREVMEGLGFTNVKIRVIDEFVFAPFADYVRDGGCGTREWVDPYRWARFSGAARAIRWAGAGKVHFVIVTGVKPE